MGFGLGAGFTGGPVPGRPVAGGPVAGGPVAGRPVAGRPVACGPSPTSPCSIFFSISFSISSLSFFRADLVQVLNGTCTDCTVLGCAHPWSFFSTLSGWSVF